MVKYYIVNNDNFIGTIYLLYYNKKYVLEYVQVRVYYKLEREFI